MKETTHILSGLLLVVAVALALGSSAAVLAKKGEVPLGTEQVEHGQTVFREHCAECHGRDLGGTPQFPALVGEAFEADWAGRTLGEFYTYVHDNMPLGAGGSLTDEQYADVVAYVLAQNGLATGERPFEPAEGAEALDAVLAFPEEGDAAE